MDDEDKSLKKKDKNELVQWEKASLKVVGCEDEPAAEGEAGVDEKGTEQEAQHGRQRLLERDDEHVVSAEETQIAQHAEPDEEAARAE